MRKAATVLNPQFGFAKPTHFYNYVFHILGEGGWCQKVAVQDPFTYNAEVS